jgi:DNA-binding NarL/FixJ family response regulator
VHPDATVVTVLIADDSPLMRLALTEVLNAEPDLHVVAVADSADEAIRQAETHLPTVAVLDVRMPGNGLAAAARIHHTAPSIKIIALTGDATALSSPDLTHWGITDALLKGASNAEIIAAVRYAAGTGSAAEDTPDTEPRG